MNKKPFKKNALPDNANPHNQLNIQNNIFMENELNAIGKLPESLAQRAMDLLEKLPNTKCKWTKKF